MGAQNLAFDAIREEAPNLDVLRQHSCYPHVERSPIPMYSLAHLA